MKLDHLAFLLLLLLFAWTGGRITFHDNVSGGGGGGGEGDKQRPEMTSNEKDVPSKLDRGEEDSIGNEVSTQRVGEDPDSELSLELVINGTTLERNRRDNAPPPLKCCP